MVMLRRTRSGPSGPSVYWGQADPADRAAVANHPEGHLQCRLAADAFQHGVGAIAAGQLPDPFDALGPPLGNDVGGAELPSQVGAHLVAAHEDDRFGAEPLGGQDS